MLIANKLGSASGCWNLTKILHGNFSKNLNKRMCYEASRQKHSFPGINENLLRFSPEIRQGFSDKKPIVALESTIITHGMPYPKNLETALQVEDIIRDLGAIPATIGIINGEIRIGMDAENLSYLAEKSSHPGGPIKVSRRDFPYVIANKMDGGTTVAGTMLIANMVGISVFVTGGIGGVHRGGHESMDVSADLIELGRTPVCVVSSGIKSILDIGRTLEFLETQGVCVATYGPNTEFPAFYTTRSGYKSPYNVEGPLEAARMIKSVKEFDLRSGLLIAVPVPEEHSMDEDLIENAIKKALRRAEDENARGKEITPIILAAVAEITKGKSLQTNMALIKNNARVGARIAVELKKLESSPESQGGDDREGARKTLDGQKEKLQINLDTAVHLSAESSIFLPKQTKREISPVIIGGSNVDSTIKIAEPEIILNGSTHSAKVTRSWGGVGRNVAECLYKLGAEPILLTALDAETDRCRFSRFKCRTPKPSPEYKNASYTAILDHKGECRIGLGDMAIHDTITPHWIAENRDVFETTPLIVMDGNISIPAMESVLEIADELRKPVLFEPTDYRKATKPFRTKYSHAVTFATPNINELIAIGSFYGYSKQCNHGIESIVDLSRYLSKYINGLIVTMGKNGVLVVRRGSADQTLIDSRGDVNVRLYPIDNEVNVVNVSGAGDCFTGGLIYSMLKNSTESVCLSVAYESARTALRSEAVIPDVLFDENHLCWNSEHPFKTLH